MFREHRSLCCYRRDEHASIYLSGDGWIVLHNHLLAGMVWESMLPLFGDLAMISHTSSMVSWLLTK